MHTEDPREGPITEEPKEKPIFYLLFIITLFKVCCTN